MGLFGRKGFGLPQKNATAGGFNWMQAIQEAKIQNTRMNDLTNIYQGNKSKF